MRLDNRRREQGEQTQDAAQSPQSEHEITVQGRLQGLLPLPPYEKPRYRCERADTYYHYASNNNGLHDLNGSS